MVPVGEAIELTWAGVDPPAVTVGGRVVHVKSDVEGNSAGILFHSPLSPETFLAIRTGRHPA